MNWGCRNLSIVRKVLALTVAGFLVFTAVVAFYQTKFAAPTTEHLSEERLANDLDHVADKLNSLTREQLNISLAFARWGEFIRGLVRSGNTQLLSDEEGDKLIGIQAAKKVESFPWILGAGIYYEPFALDPDSKSRGYFARWVPPVGASRKVEFASAHSGPKVDYHDQSWYRSLIPAGWNPQRHLFRDSTWTQPYRDPVTLIPIITIVTAMYSDDSKLIGLAAVDTNLDDISQLIAKLRPTKNSISLLFSPTSKKIAAVAGLEGLNLDPIESVRWMPYLLLNAPSERFEMVPAQDDAGLPFRVYSRTLDSGLTLSLIIPEAEIFADVTELQSNQLYVLLAAAALSLAMVLLFIREALRPLATIRDVAREYVQGDFSRTLQIHRDDEFGDISQAFNSVHTLVDSLGDSIRQIGSGQIRQEIPEGHLISPIREEMNILILNIRTFFEQLDQLRTSLERGSRNARIDPNRFQGDWKLGVRTIDHCVEILERPLLETTSICRRAAEGDFSTRIFETRNGMFEHLRAAINDMAASHERITRQHSGSLEILKISQSEALLAAQTRSVVLGNACEEFSMKVKQIANSLGALQRESLSNEDQRAMSACDEITASLLDFVEELREHSRIEAGNVTEEREPFRLHRLLFDMKDMLRAHSLRQRQELRLFIDPNVPDQLVGNQTMLRNILLNLGMQAVQNAGEAGSVTLSVECVYEAAEAMTLSISVTDTGGASLARSREKVLQSLDSDAAISSAVERGGLAYLISKRLAVTMGGSLEIESQFGLGVRCQFTVPFLSKAGAASSAAAEAVDSIPDGMRTKALFLEQNFVTQKLVANILREGGWAVETVEDTADAIRSLDTAKFDLVLLDVDLPAAAGFETARLIRESGKPFAKVPIVAVTSDSKRIRKQQLSESGLNGYLTKPLQMASVREMMARLGAEWEEETKQGKSSTEVPM